MASGVAKLFDTDWGIAITGYASPVPEQGIEDLFAWIAFSHHSNIVFTHKMNAPRGNPSDVRRYYKDNTIRTFMQILSQA